MYEEEGKGVKGKRVCVGMTCIGQIYFSFI